MKLLILLFITVTSAWAKPLVLISYYDAFGRASFNNSEKVAKALEAKFNRPDSPLTVKLCGLNTVFDKAYAQVEECFNTMPEKPVLVLGLGESNCELKIETMMRNNDRTVSADNAGNSRSNTVIIASAPSVLGLRYPLPQMYCALTDVEQGLLNLSNDAGSFVCNNTSFQMSYNHPEIQYGFIHVPANNCANLARKTESSLTILEKMIIRGVSYLDEKDEVDEGLPHSSNDLRLPTRKDELKRLRSQYSGQDACLSEYLRRARGYDEKRSIFFTK